MEGKFDSTHISISKVKLQYTQTLSEAGDEYDE